MEGFLPFKYILPCARIDIRTMAFAHCQRHNVVAYGSASFELE